MKTKIEEACSRILREYQLDSYDENYLESVIEDIYKDSCFNDLSINDRVMIWQDMSVALKVKFGVTKRVYRVDPRSS